MRRGRQNCVDSGMFCYLSGEKKFKRGKQKIQKMQEIKSSAAIWSKQKLTIRSLASLSAFVPKLCPYVVIFASMFQSDYTLSIRIKMTTFGHQFNEIQ